MPAETKPTVENVLADEAQKAFENLIPFRVIHATTRFIPGIPFWLRALLFCLVYAAIWEGWAWLSHEQGFTYLAIVYAMVVLLATHISFEIIGQGILRILHKDLAPYLSSTVAERAAHRLKSGLTLGKQLIVAILGSGVCLAAGVAIYLSSSLHFNSPFVFIGAIICFVLALPYWHFEILFLSSALLFAEDEAALYPLDPRQSPIVRASTAVTQRIAVIFAIQSTLGLVLTILLAPGSELFAFTVAVVMAAGVLPVVGGLFALQQTGLSRIVASRRARTLSELQTELQAYYDQRGNLDEAAQKRFDYLLALHDRVAQTSDLAIDWRGALRFFTPALLPLLSLLLSNIDLPFLTQDIRNLLQRVLSQH